MITLEKKKILRNHSLGSGAFGQVYPYGKNLEEAKWAIKQLFPRHTDELLLVMQEIVLGFSCNHAAIVPVIGYFLEKNPDAGPDAWYVYIKLPRLKHNLRKIIKDIKNPENNIIPKEDIIQYLYTLTSALIYLHDRRIAHRDIKPDNILVDENGKVKLTDIGAAQFFAEGDPSILEKPGGTPFYMSPELCLFDKNDPLTRRDLYKCDIWSLGIVATELCLIKPQNISSQYAIEKKQEIVFQNLEKIEQRYDQKFAGIIRKMLCFDKHERISAHELNQLLKETYPDLLSDPEKDIKEGDMDEMNGSQHIIKYFKESKDRVRTDLEKKWKGWFTFESPKTFEIRPNKNPWMTERIISDCIDDVMTTLREYKVDSMKSISLNLARCQQLTDEGISKLSEQICGNMRDLQQLSLNLTECVQISNTGFDKLSASIGDNLKSLQDLSLIFSECSQFSDESLNTLSNYIEESMPNLERLSLDLSGCFKLTDSGIMSWVFNTESKMSQIRQLSLNLFGCYKITDDGRSSLIEFIKNMSNNLEDLVLKFCWQDVADDQDVQNLSAAVSTLKKLKSLELSFRGCAKLSENGVRSLIKDIQKLYNLENLSLSFEWCVELNEQARDYICELLKAKSQQLQKLNLKFDECTGIRDFKPFHKTLATLSRLQELSLSFDNLLNYNGNEMEALAQIPHVQKLSLSFVGCQKIAGYSFSSLVKQIGQNLKLLQELSLNFKGCNGINDQSAAEFGLYCGRDMTQLRTLSLNLSRTSLSVEGIRKMCNHLGSFDKKLISLALLFEGCQQIKDEVAWALFGLKANQLRELKHLTIDFRDCENVKLSDKTIMGQKFNFVPQVVIL